MAAPDMPGVRGTVVLSFSPRRLSVRMGWLDVALFAILIAVAVGIASGVRDAVEPPARLRFEPIVLSTWALPHYALLTAPIARLFTFD